MSQLYHPGGGGFTPQAEQQQHTPLPYLSFQGKDPATGYRKSFDVLCGAADPKITGGYAEWSTVSRPLQRALTIPKDFPPVEMTCDVIFGSWVGQYGLPHGWQQNDTTGKRVEADIAALEWMAGGGGTGGHARGQAPWVYVMSYSGQNSKAQSGLIPPQYRGLQWVITALAWGQGWRNASEYRIYQEATVTLTNFLSLTPAGSATTDAGGSWFVSSPGRDTALKIAASPSIASPTLDYQSLARTILGAKANNPCRGTTIKLKGRSIHWAIRHGVHVYVPSHTVT